jgi:hypothetical protein
MGIFDWLKSLLVTGPPSLPPPFTWITDYVFEHVIRPVGRSFQEISSACKLAYSVVVDVWEHRDWWVDRAQLKLDAVMTRTYNMVVEGITSELTFMAHWIERTLATLETALRAAIADVWQLVSNVVASLNAFIVNIFTPWRNLVETFRVWAKAQLDDWSGWTVDVIHYWLSVYHGYRVVLSEFLANPLGYILALLERDLGLWWSWILRQATIVLDKAW